jgi:hypothetical protein
MATQQPKKLPQSLRDVIDAARADIATWPQWMRKLVCQHRRMEVVHRDNACSLERCPDCGTEVHYGL